MSEDSTIHSQTYGGSRSTQRIQYLGERGGRRLSMLAEGIEVQQKRSNAQREDQHSTLSENDVVVGM